MNNDYQRIHYKYSLFTFGFLQFRRISIILTLVILNSFIPNRNIFSQIQVDDGKDPEYYEYIIKLYAPTEDAFIALQRLAKPYLDKREWNKAIKVFEDNKSKFLPISDRIDKIVAILKAPEEGIHMRNLGGNINTQYPEYGPVISPDGRKLYFTGRDRPDGIGGEDIFVSYFVNGSWTQGKLLSGNINTESNEYMNSISADGNILVLFGNYENSLGRGDNFYVEKTAKGWSEIKTFPPPINSKYWDADAYLTADGQAILFSTDRPGGIGPFHPKGEYYHGMFWGNTDIYVVLKEGDGWSKTAINLGPTINTQYTERTPFLHPDGKTLYFSSDGHPGLGKSDVFKSVRLSDSSWTDWSEPVNLGKEINTSEEDWGYKITTDGKRAYFSTVSDQGFGEEDIYYVDLPQSMKPDRDVITVNGKILDEKGKPVEATIRWSDVDQMKEVGVAKTDPGTGEYFIALPVGRYYAYYADVRGYFSPVEYLDLTEAKAYKEIKNDVNIISVDELKNSGKSIKLENIFFDFDKYDLKEKSYEALNTLLRFMKDNPDIMVEINAYTDNIGSDKYNKSLSENRASSVVNYLIQKGIEQTRLISIGHGKDDPVASNNTEEGRALNRRVEFRLKK
jgi:outer membrane protein OmpA-like peptidoglycan-associated protein